MKPYRTDVDARMATQEEIDVNARLGVAEHELKYYQDRVQMERREKEAADARVRELEGQMKGLEAQKTPPSKAGCSQRLSSSSRWR